MKQSSPSYIASHATISTFYEVAVPAATLRVNANRGTSSSALDGLHSSTPVNIAAASTAAGTAALAAGTALAVTAGIAAPAAGTAVRAVVKAASVASRSVPTADTAASATNTQSVAAGAAERSGTPTCKFN